MKTITVTAVRNVNGRRALSAKEFGAFECYTPPGFDSSFSIRPNDKLNVRYYQPDDLLTRNPLPHFQAEAIEKPN